MRWHPVPWDITTTPVGNMEHLIEHIIQTQGVYDFTMQCLSRVTLYSFRFYNG